MNKSSRMNNTLRVMLAAVSIILTVTFAAAAIVPGVRVHAEEAGEQDPVETDPVTETETETEPALTVTEIKFGESTVKLSAGEEKVLTVKAFLSDGSESPDVPALVFTSSDDSVAAVDAEGKVTAVADGSAEIKAESEDGSLSCVCTVTVETETEPVITVTEIKFDESSIKLSAGEEKVLTVKAFLSDGTESPELPALVFTSSDDSVATVDAEGKVTAVADGSAEIKAESEDGSLSCVCTVTVETETEPVITVTEIRFGETTVRLSAGEETVLTVKAFLSDGSESPELPALVFSSADESVATVDAEGKVTAVAGGRVEIKAENEDGSLSCVCTVIVSTSKIKLRTISSTGERIATGINPGDTVGVIIDDITASESLEPGKVTILTAAGAAAPVSERMKTGMVINVDGTTYMAVIYGDCNGDGVINSRDVQTILDYLTSKSNLLADNRANFLSADFLNNGVTLESALYLQRYYYGLETIEQ